MTLYFQIRSKYIKYHNMNDEELSVLHYHGLHYTIKY